MLLLAVVEIDLIYAGDATESIINLPIFYIIQDRGSPPNRRPMVHCIRPPARFPATPSIFAVGRSQAYETTRIFGVAALRKKIFPDFSRMAGKTESWPQLL